jgi:phosphatidylinositol-3,4,5-trisphosphate 3-phosphatase/dual-specificity protein phosphatase PTEN
MLPASDRPNGSADAVLMATETADELMNIMSADEDTQKALVEDTASDAVEAGTSPTASSKSDDAPASAPSRALNQADTPTGARTPVSSARPAPLEHVLDLHTSKRMRALAEKKATPADKQKKGVSIPSQRRWLLYWSLLLAGAGPRGFWGLHGPAPPRLKVRVVSVRVRLREQRGAMPILARAVNTIMEQGGLGNRNAPGHRRDEVWVSLAKYDDKLVDTLESWERQTRVDDTKLGTRKPGSEHMEGADLVDVFKAGSWDKEKVSTLAFVLSTTL